MNQIEINHTMSSREIAAMTGKEHRHVMRDIRSIEVNLESPNLDSLWKSTFYTNSQGKQQPMYNLTKKGSLLLATKYNDNIRLKLIDRWEELEKQSAKPTQLDFSNPNVVLQLAQNWADEQQKRLEAEKTIEQNKPKVLFADAIIGSKNSCLIGELAKILAQNGIQIGGTRLFAYLRENGYLGKVGERYNIPNQRYIEQGLFELKKGAHARDGVIHNTTTTKVTGKGQSYFINHFLNTMYDNQTINKH